MKEKSSKEQLASEALLKMLTTTETGKLVAAALKLDISKGSKEVKK